MRVAVLWKRNWEKDANYNQPIKPGLDPPLRLRASVRHVSMNRRNSSSFPQTSFVYFIFQSKKRCSEFKKIKATFDKVNVKK